MSINVLLGALAFAVVISAAAFLASLWLWRHPGLEELANGEAERNTRPKARITVRPKP